MSQTSTLIQIFTLFQEEYGPRHWWPADSPFEVMLGAILTQNTAWTNAEKAITGFKQVCDMMPEALLSLSTERLQEVIRSSGYFRQKSMRLQGLCRFLLDYYEGDIPLMEEVPTQKLREQFLSLNGIGPETADSILLYALSRPVFVVDAYTVRLLSRLGYCGENSKYEEVQAFFMENLEPDAVFFNEYHALIVIHCKQRCRKQTPICAECPLMSECGWVFKIQNSKFKK